MIGEEARRELNQIDQRKERKKVTIGKMNRLSGRNDQSERIPTDLGQEIEGGSDLMMKE